MFFLNCCAYLCYASYPIKYTPSPLFFLVAQPPYWAQATSFLILRDHTQTHFSGRGIGPSQRPVPDHTQYSPETEIRATGGIRTRNSSKRATAVPCLRPRGHRRR
jgi:hypothetical protein